MDLEEWEFLPTNDGFIDLDGDGVRKIIHSGIKRNSNPENVLDLDYFVYPSQDQQRSGTLSKQLVQVPISWEPIVADKGLEDTNPEKETTKSENSDQETVSSFSSQVSFKKLKENEFVDMKLDSPKGNNSRATSPRISDFPQIDTIPSAIDESFGAEIESPGKRDQDDMDEKLNVWKLGVSGVGAICSFGVAAAATVCIILFGNNQKNNNRIRFQIYTDSKVVPHAAKLNAAIAAASGVLVHNAQISFGGCYSGI